MAVQEHHQGRTLKTLQEREAFRVGQRGYGERLPNRPWDDPREVKGLVEFARLHKLGRIPLVTTRTARGVKTVDGIEVEFAPASLHCYTVGRNTLERSR